MRTKFGLPRSPFPVPLNRCWCRKVYRYFRTTTTNDEDAGVVEFSRRSAPGTMAFASVKRRNGFSAPLSSDQIKVFVLYPCNLAGYYALVTFVLYYNEPLRNGLLFLNVALTLVILCAWLSAELIDPEHAPGKTGLPVVCYRPPEKSSRYCGGCRKTVMGLDHHCSWLNTCIGRRNYVPFVVLVFTGAAQQGPPSREAAWPHRPISSRSCAHAPPPLAPPLSQWCTCPWAWWRSRSGCKTTRPAPAPPPRSTALCGATTSSSAPSCCSPLSWPPASSCSRVSTPTSCSWRGRGRTTGCCRAAGGGCMRPAATGAPTTRTLRSGGDALLGPAAA